MKAVAAYLQTIDLRRATRELTADHFGVTPSTLSRALTRAGSGFAELVDAERLRRLDELAGTFTDFPRAKQIHRSLGFLQVNSFYRWYNRTSPKVWSEARHVLS